MARSAYVAVVLLATLSSLHFDARLADVGPRLLRAFEPGLRMRDAVDAARNVALFAGLGVVWVVTSPSGRVWRAALHATLAALALSATVETMQLFSPVRDSSVLDVLTNTTGALAGALVAARTALALARAAPRRSFVGVPALVFALCYATAVAMDAFAPLFRQDLLPYVSGGPGERMLQALAAMRLASLARLPVLDMLIFAPAGAFAVAALAERGVAYGSAWRAVAAWGTVAMISIEIAHGVVGQPIILGAALVHSIAIGAAAWATARWLPRATVALRGRLRPAWLAAAYASVIATWSWRPFVPQIDPAAIAAQFTAAHWVPLLALGGRVDVFSVADVIAQFSLYLPLGALLAVWPLRRTGALRGVLPAVYLALGMEFGKIFVDGRFFDITHVLIQSAAAWTGAILVRRSGYPVRGYILPGERA